MSSEQIVLRPPKERPDIARNKAETIKSGSVSDCLVQVEFPAQQLRVPDHLRAPEEIGIIAHVLFVDDFAPHTEIPDSLHPHSGHFFNVVMAAKSVNGLHRGQIPVLHHAHEVVSRVMNLHHIGVVRIILITVRIIDERAVGQRQGPFLKVLDKAFIQRIVIIQISCQNPLVHPLQPAHHFPSENIGKETSVLRLHINGMELRASCLIRFYPLFISIRRLAVKQDDPFKVLATLADKGRQTIPLKEGEAMLQPFLGPYRAATLVLVPKEKVEAGQDEMMHLNDPYSS